PGVTVGIDHATRKCPQWFQANREWPRFISPQQLYFAQTFFGMAQDQGTRLARIQAVHHELSGLQLLIRRLFQAPGVISGVWQDGGQAHCQDSGQGLAIGSDYGTGQSPTWLQGNVTVRGARSLFGWMNGHKGVVHEVVDRERHSLQGLTVPTFDGARESIII